MSIAQDVFEVLKARDELVVFAESCTCGMVAALMGQVPGVSDVLCGSSVVYRENTKEEWLCLTRHLIDTYTTESPEVAEDLALAVLDDTCEADYSVAVVGHLGPNAPEEKDGLIHIAIAEYGDENPVCHADKKLVATDRQGRQREAAEFVLEFLLSHLKNKNAD